MSSSTGFYLQHPTLNKTAEIKAHAGEITDVCFDPSGKLVGVVSLTAIRRQILDHR